MGRARVGSRGVGEGAVAGDAQHARERASARERVERERRDDDVVCERAHTPSE